MRLYYVRQCKSCPFLKRRWVHDILSIIFRTPETISQQTGICSRDWKKRVINHVGVGIAKWCDLKEVPENF